MATRVLALVALCFVVIASAKQPSAKLNVKMNRFGYSLHDLPTVSRLPGSIKAWGEGYRGYRVAVLISGSVVRYQTNLDEYLVAPIVRQGHTVDVYLALNTAKHKGYNSHADHFVKDPRFENETSDAVKTIIATGIKSAGGNLRRFDLFHDVNLTRNDVNFIMQSRWWKERPHRDGAAARRNIMKTFKPMQALWDAAKHVEELRGRYTHVMILRDDARWFAHFDLNRIVARSTTLSQHAHGYALSCEPGRSSFSPGTGIVDFVYLLERAAAEPFASFYTEIMLGTNGTQYSEAFVVALAKKYMVQFHEVPAGLFPFQRIGRVQDADGRLRECLHYVCDSASEDVPYVKPERLWPLCGNMRRHS